MLYYHFDEKMPAIAKYFTICAAAAVSSLPYHAVHIITSDGMITEQYIFDRRTDGNEAAT